MLSDFFHTLYLRSPCENMYSFFCFCDNNCLHSRLPPIPLMLSDFFHTLYLRSPCENMYSFFVFVFAHCPLSERGSGFSPALNWWSIKLHPQWLVTEFEVHFATCVRWALQAQLTTSFHSLSSSRRWKAFFASLYPKVFFLTPELQCSLYI
jgi:hypothetical protein